MRKFLLLKESEEILNMDGTCLKVFKRLKSKKFSYEIFKGKRKVGSINKTTYEKLRKLNYESIIVELKDF